MPASAYFLVNDTRFDNHHGGLTVVKNLQLGLERRGWTCTGSLPVSATARQLPRHRPQIEAARLVVINGEGSLHHDSRNAGRLFEICAELQPVRPLALVNALWQDNDLARWKPLLARFVAVYARDRRSQAQLQAGGIDADYAPDLTFYEYPRFTGQPRARFGCTDSVLKSWTAQVLQLCQADEDFTYLPLFTGQLQFRRGARDWEKALKYAVYPWLSRICEVPVPPRYRALDCAIGETEAFLCRLASCRAVCAARYHALCFALQQNIPFVAVTSNSHKSEALLEEVGLPRENCLIGPNETEDLKARLEAAVAGHPAVAGQIEEFNRRARQLLDGMFDRIANQP